MLTHFDLICLRKLHEKTNFPQKSNSLFSHLLHWLLIYFQFITFIITETVQDF